MNKQTNETNETLDGTWQKYIDHRFLAGEDFENKVVKLTVKSVTQTEAFDPNSKKNKVVTVVYFEETDKGIILNLTNSRAISSLTGTNVLKEWVGKVIPFYGKPDKRYNRVVRVKLPTPNVKV